MNKIIKFLGYICVHLFMAVTVYLLALALVSPVMNIAMGIMDVLHNTPAMFYGKYFVIWLLLALIPWIPLFIYVEVKSYKDTHQKIKQ